MSFCLLCSQCRTLPSLPTHTPPLPEWVLVDSALHAYSMVSVPLYDTLGPDAVEYICNHAELAAVACSAAVLPVLLQCVARCPSVKCLVGAGRGGHSRASECVGPTFCGAWCCWWRGMQWEASDCLAPPPSA